MYFEALSEFDYNIYGEERRAVKGNEIYIPVRSVVKQLLKEKKIVPLGEKGVTLAEIANPKKPEVKKEDVPLRVGGLVRIKNAEEIATVLEILEKQIKVEYTSGQTKRVAKSRIEEVLD